MKVKKTYYWNSTPFGIVFIIISVALPLIGIYLCINMICKWYELVYFFAVSIAFFLICYFSNLLNFLKINYDGITHNKNFLSWNEAKITAVVMIDRLGGGVYLYFGNKYLCKFDKQEIKQNKFRIHLTVRRAKIILSLYHKPIPIISLTGYSEDCKVYWMIVEHNSNPLNLNDK